MTLEQRPASEWVYPEPGRTVTSDASGDYHFYSLFPGDYWLRFTEAQGIYTMKAQRDDATGSVFGWYSGETIDGQFVVAAGSILEKMDIYILELGEPTCFMPYIDNAPSSSR